MKDIIYSVKLGIAKSKNTLIFKEFPLSNNDSIFRIKVDKWYHNFFKKQKIKLIKYYLKKRNKCNCICHITPGFHHCWDNGCCDKENLNWRKM